MKIGRITKNWSGFEKEAFTDADNFGVTFPKDLDVKCKVTLLAAVFLIVSEQTILDFMISPHNWSKWSDFERVF